MRFREETGVRLTMVRVRLLRRSDIGQVVSCWNFCLPYDRITVEQFEDTIFDDPNFEKEGNLVATTKVDEIVGFVGAVVREGIIGKDGAGRVEEKDYGYIKCLFVLNDCRKGTQERLLKQALAFLESKGKKLAKVGQYSGRYFFPGIDAKYNEELTFFKENGFEESDVEEDVAINLEDFEPTKYQRRAQQRMEKMGVIIRSYQPESFYKMRRFVKEINYPQWFPEGWELDFGEHHYHLVALLAAEIVGWARFFKHQERWWFGPIAVLEKVRRRGIGTCLLLQSMLQMKTLGAPNVTAGWANVPFYVKNRWRTSRRYIVLQKNLTD